MLLFHDFRSSTPAISPVELGRVFLIIPDTLSVTGFLDRPGWWLPFPPLFLFSSFGLNLSHGVYVRCLRGNLFSIISLLGTVQSSVKTHEILSDLIIPGVSGRGALQLGRSSPVSLIGLGYFFGFGKSTLVPTETSIFLGYIIDFTYTAFLMPRQKKVKLASFQENMLSHKTVFLSLCRSLWEDKLLYTLVPAARLFSRFSCGVFGHITRHWRLQELFS